MKQQIRTPYGTFKSLTEASDHIARYHIIEFVRDNPKSKYPYRPSMDHHRDGTNNASLHFVWSVIKYEKAPYEGKPQKGWARI